MLLVAVLAVISVLGVWDFFSGDVIWKSFQTIGLAAFVAIIVIVAGDYMEKGKPLIVPANPVWSEIKKATLVILVIAVSLLALLGILSIWVIEDREILFKSISSLAILGLGGLLIAATCHHLEGKDRKQEMVPAANPTNPTTPTNFPNPTNPQ